jgi:hypothetical protein
MLLIAATIAILALGEGAARADMEIWISTSNNPPLSTDSVAGGATSASFSGSVGGYSISMLASGSNSPGGSAISFLTGTTLTITNVGATNHLFITLGQTGFTMPVTPPNISMLSHIGGTTFVADSSNLLTFQSYVNTANGQNAASGITTGPQSPVITGTSAWSSDAVPLTITSLAATYSMTERFDLFLSTGSMINFSSSTTLTNIPLNAIPEPSSLAIAGVGALGMIGFGLRRRKALGA